MFCVIEGEVFKTNQTNPFYFSECFVRKEREKVGSHSCFVTFGGRTIQWVQSEDSIDTSASGSPWVCKMFALNNELKQVILFYKLVCFVDELSLK